MLSLGFRAYNSALGMVYTGGYRCFVQPVQRLCTGCTEALYRWYSCLVPLVQLSCTMIKPQIALYLLLNSQKATNTSSFSYISFIISDSFCKFAPAICQMAVMSFEEDGADRWSTTY